MVKKSSVFLLAIILNFSAVKAQSRKVWVNEQLGTTKLCIFEEERQPIFESWKSILYKITGASLKTDWKIYGTLKDDLGQVHYRCRQYYQGIPLENGTYIIHSKSDKIISVNGDFIPEKLINGKLILTETEALNRALAFLPAEKYYWQNEAQNASLQYVTGVKDTSFFPHGLVVWVAESLNYLNAHKLSYKFNVYAEEPLAAKTIYVDAENGNIVASEDLIKHTDVKGSGVTAYSGTRTITTDSTAPGNYRLRETGRANGIETYNMKTGTAYGSAVDFTDADNFWNNANAAKDHIATDAHWGAEKTYDFFDSVFGRKSFDNNKAKILSYVHYSTSYANAFWDGIRMTYGDGNSGLLNVPLTSLDVCGHEIAHAVTSYSAGLIYSYESGALNESFSDIFGNTIEQWARPNKWKWLIGEDITSGFGGIRNMANPNAFSHPKYYKGASWYAGAGDNGGVHYNSGVQNYWYYLIAQGSKGTNEKGNSFKIDTLGIINAAKIAYRNLTVYLTKNAQYSDARIYSIMAATDLFGLCSKEVINVTNAWWVCGVGAKYDSAFVKAAFIGDTLACFTANTIKFSNQSDNAKSYKWHFGDGSNSAATNPSHTYNTYGTFNVKLVALACFKGKLDSITKVNYVKIDSSGDVCISVLLPKSGIDSGIRCKGYIYDDGGEGNYSALKTVIFKLKIPGADSIRFRFLVLDYQKGFDSLYFYKNTMTVANKIGGYTGNTLPFGGGWQTISANALWIKQVSDPLVEGKGVKIQFEGIRKPLVVNLGKDTTICFGDSITLKPTISGGYAANFAYAWNNGNTVSQIGDRPKVNTTFILKLTDVCTGKFKSDTIQVFVRPALDIKLRKDTIICNGRSVNLQTTSAGGLSTAYNYNWNNGLPSTASNLVIPLTTTTYRVILSDGCTVKPDTAFQTVFVKPPLKATISANSTLVCINQTVNLSVNGAGGDTAKYVFTWNKALGTGTSKSVVLSTGGTYTVSLTDGCSVIPSSDSVLIKTYPALKITKPSDTIICRGTAVNINTVASGGTGSGYNYSWNTGESTSGITKTPTVMKYYSLALSDGCSPSVSDSIKVDLFTALSLTRVNDTTLCDGQTLPVNLVGAGGKASTRIITWTPASVSGFNPTLNPATGITNYQAVLSDGCTVTTDITNFKITKLAPLSPVISVAPSAICAGDSVKMTFTLSGGKSANYAYTLNGTPAFFLKQTIQPTASSVYKLDLTDGCSTPATSSASVTISPAAFATLSVDPKIVCENSGVLFKFNSPDAAKVMWYFSSKDSGNGAGIDYPKTFKGAGSFTAKAKITTSMGCSAMFTLLDTVKAIPYPKAIFTPNPDITDIENPTIVITDASIGAASYFWDFGNGTSSTIPGSVSNTYADTGWFKIRLMVSVSPGCVDSTSHMVRIKDVFRIYMPTSFTPDQNGVNDVFLPKGRGFKTFQMTIFNRWGMKVFESSDMNKGWDGLDDKGKIWAPGSYVVIVEIIDTQDFRHVEKSTVLLLK